MTAKQKTQLRQTNLARANAVRFDRVELRKRVVAGEMRLADLLLPEPHPSIIRMKADQLLRWLPNIGPVRARSIMHMVHPNPGIKIEHMTERLRASLAERADAVQ